MAKAVETFNEELAALVERVRSYQPSSHREAA
jgi:hypothetical protein